MLTVEVNMLYRKLKRKMKNRGAGLETLKGQIGISFFYLLVRFVFASSMDAHFPVRFRIRPRLK